MGHVMCAMYQIITKWSHSSPPSVAKKPKEHITAPEDAMLINLVPGLPPSGGFENFLTAMDVFSRFLFAYPTSNQDDKTLVKNTSNITTKQAYLPTTLIPDRGSDFVSQVIKEVVGVLSITPLQSRLKQMRCSNDLTRQSNKHWRLKQASEDLCGINTAALWSSITIHLITQALDVSQTEFFVEVFLTLSRLWIWDFSHSKHPFPPRKLPKMSLIEDRRSNKMFAKMLCKLTSHTKLIRTKWLTLQSSKKQNTYVFQPKPDHQRSKIAFTELRRIGPCKIEKVLPDSKIGSNKTQVFHRMPMRQFTLRQSLPYIWITPKEGKPYPEMSLKHDDLYPRAWECEYKQQIFDEEKKVCNATKFSQNCNRVWFFNPRNAEHTRNCTGLFLRSFFPKPQTEELCDVTGTVCYVELDAETSS